MFSPQVYPGGYNIPGLLLLAAVTSFVWVLLLADPENLYMLAKVGSMVKFTGYCSLGGFVCGCVAILSSSTVIEFIKVRAPANAKLKGHVAIAGFLGVDVLLLAGLLKGSLLFWIIVVLLCMLWVFLCFMWYRHVVEIRDRAKESDYHKQIREICAETAELVFDAIGRQAFVRNIIVSEEGLKFVNIENELLYRWEEIRQIISTSRGLCVVNDQELGDSG